MNVERLKTLSKFLRTIPRKLFKMDNWVTTEKPENVVNHIHKPTETECGFAACAMGWACQIKSFRRIGLKLTPGNIFNEVLYPAFDSVTGFRAAERFFGLTCEESHALFHLWDYPTNNITSIQVANKIDKLIKTHAKKPLLKGD